MRVSVSVVVHVHPDSGRDWPRNRECYATVCDASRETVTTCDLTGLSLQSSRNLVCLTTTMRPSLPRLVRVIPRTQLQPEELRKLPIPEPVRSDVRRLTLIELLQKRKEEAGSDFPSNIRIEPVLTKKSFDGMKKEHIVELKSLLKER